MIFKEISENETLRTCIQFICDYKSVCCRITQPTFAVIGKNGFMGPFRKVEIKKETYYHTLHDYK